MKAQHDGALVVRAAIAQRCLFCLALALVCVTGLTSSQAIADAQDVSPSVTREKTVGIGLQRSTHEALGPSYAAAKLGVSADATLHSENVGRTAVSVYAFVDEPPAYEAGAAEHEAAYEDFGETASEADVSYEAVYEEPVYEEPVPSEPVYEEEPVYGEPAYEWYTVQASAYSVETNGGTTTASGTPLDDWSLTVASPWVPLGSVVEIEYAGVTVQAVVTDRGPYVSGRDLDLTPGVIGAFGFSDIYDWGVRTVSYRVL